MVLLSTEPGNLAKLGGYIVLVGVAVFLYNLYQARMKFRRLKTQHGIVSATSSHPPSGTGWLMRFEHCSKDIIPHSFLWGHLAILGQIQAKYKMPRDAGGQIMPYLVSLEYPKIAGKGYVYLDVWPLTPAMLAVYHPDMMAQFTQDRSQPKHPNQKATFMPFTAGEDLLTTEGSQWKSSRAIFNPGFSLKNLMSLMPLFVDEAEVFRTKLRALASTGDVVRLEKYTTDLTVDIIGQAVLGTRLHAQQRPCTLVEAMLSQVPYLHFGLEPLKRFNPLKYYHHHRLNRQFSEEVMPYIRDTVRNYEKLEGPKTILRLAVKSYVEEEAANSGGRSEKTAAGELPPEFLRQVVHQVKIFLFAGHDTTATTLAYAYYELARNPDAARKTRAEHDLVLGPDPGEAGRRIAADPTLLNAMPYTLAVVRETLRLYPVVGTVRAGAPGFSLVVPETGERCPTDGFMLFGSSAAMQRLPRFWHEPDRFVPDRWLFGASTPVAAAPENPHHDDDNNNNNNHDDSNPWHPRKNAFRPWEMGPRNCIGQELASLELRLILATTVREFDVAPAAYDGPGDPPTFLGSAAYQVEPPGSITTHPKDGMRVRVLAR